MSPAAVRRSTAIEMEVQAGDEPVLVLLNGVTIAVKPVKQWRSSGLRALRQGDFLTWGDTCLTDESVSVWADIDPTIGEVEVFFEAWGEASGQSVGKSPASARSSTTTRKR